jgi:hypothetical protein
MGADIELLAAVDEAHETLSGPATQKIQERELYEFHDERYKRLAGLSVAQLYRLRKSRTYRQRRVAYQPTRPTQAIGERRRPDPRGRPGYLRVDTVHQGDRDGIKGLFHINAADEVTQWEVVGATAHISEAWLMPVLEAMLGQFPFRILGFHSDNGIELSITKWRSCSTNCWPNKPSRVRGTATTTVWWKPKTAGSFANTSVTVILPLSMPKPSTSSFASTSIRI